MLLSRRVDALTIAFKGTLRPDVRRVLLERAECVKRLRTAVDVEVPGMLREIDRARLTVAPGVLEETPWIDIGRLMFEMHARSRDGWWRLANADFRIIVDEQGAGGWVLALEPTAVLLGRFGHRVAFEFASRLAICFLGIGATAARIRRVDLCADFMKFDLEVPAAAWLAPRRSLAVETISFTREYSIGDRRTGVAVDGAMPVHELTDMADERTGEVFSRSGIAIGKNDVRLRVYDKTEELRLSRNAGNKRDEEHARWARAGWDGKQPVIRTEFQVRGKVLEELDMRDPERLLESLDALWAYCSCEWVRLIVPGTSTRRCRCDVDSRWLAVQAVRFEREAVSATRVRRRASPHWRLVFSMARNAIAGTGELERVPDASDVRGWTEERAREFVRNYHRGIGSSVAKAADDVAEGLLSDSRFASAQDVAEYVAQRNNAAFARNASAVAEGRTLAAA